MALSSFHFTCCPGMIVAELNETLALMKKFLFDRKMMKKLLTVGINVAEKEIKIIVALMHWWFTIYYIKKRFETLVLLDLPDL